MLTGSIVAIATPMAEGGALDLPALGKLIDFHAANGTAGIVIVGTTGESPTVDVDEHCLLIESAVKFARGNEAFGRPAKPAFLLAPGELLHIVAGRLDVVAYEEGRITREGRDSVVQRIAAVGPGRAWPPMLPPACPAD